MTDIFEIGKIDESSASIDEPSASIDEHSAPIDEPSAPIDEHSASISLISPKSLLSSKATFAYVNFQPIEKEMILRFVEDVQLVMNQLPTIIDNLSEIYNLKFL